MISIITPALIQDEQHAAWLEEAILSVQEQTYDDWEMIIVNDASTHDISYLHDRYDVRWYRMAKRSGVSAARNHAANLANGKFLLPLDADDKLSPDALESYMGAWPGSGFVYPDVMVFGQDFSQLRRMSNYDFCSLLRQDYIPVGALMLKDDWARSGGWNIDMELGYEDWELWIRMGEMGICGTRVPKVLYWYRKNPAGRLASIRSDRVKRNEAMARMRDLHREVYAGRFSEMACGCNRGRSSKSGLRGVKRSPRGDLKQPITVVYNGPREGGFGLVGRPSRRRYRVPGPGIEFLIEASDVKYMRQFHVRVIPTRIDDGDDSPEEEVATKQGMTKQGVERMMTPPPRLGIRDTDYTEKLSDMRVVDFVNMTAHDLDNEFPDISLRQLIQIEEAGKDRKMIREHLENLSGT